MNFTTSKFPLYPLWYFLFVVAMIGCKTDKPVDIVYLTGMWQNVELPADVIMFSYNMKDGNKTKGFFRPGMLEGSKEIAYGGSFEIKGAITSVRYRPYNTQDEYKHGDLSIDAGGLLVLPFGTYKKMSQSESIEYMNVLEGRQEN